MSRTFRAVALAGTLALIACGDPTVSIGSNSGPVPVDPSSVQVSVLGCPDGYEHANICCTGDNGQNASACMRYIGTPFHPCATGWLTYPNDNVCCALHDPSDCAAATPPQIDTNAAPGDIACGIPPKCPPGTSPDPTCKGYGCWSYVAGTGGKPATRDGFCVENKTPLPSSDGPSDDPSCVTHCPSNWFPWSESGVCCRGDQRGAPEMCFASTR